jgi:prolyl oligopeptidase
MKFALLSALCGCAASNGAEVASDPPGDARRRAQPMKLEPTRRQDLTETLFGTEVADPYRWLEDEDAPEVQDWMEARDAHARSHLASLPERGAIAERLRELLYVESRSVPSMKGGRLFYWSKDSDQEKAVLYWKDGEDGEPRVLLNPNQMSEDGSLSITEAQASKDGKFVAYMKQPNNMDESTLEIIEVDTGQLLPDRIPGLRYTRPSWTPDSKGFYYTWLPRDETIPVNERMGYGEVRYHRIGTDPANDPVVREKTSDPRRWMSAEVSEDGEFLFLTISFGWSENELFMAPIVSEEGPRIGDWTKLAEGALYSADAWKGAVYVATNDRSPNYEVYVVDPAKPARESWRLLIDARDDVVIDGMRLVGGKIALSVLEKAAGRIELWNLDGNMHAPVQTPGLGSVSGLTGSADRDVAYFSFSSFNRPPEIWATQVEDGSTRLLHRTDVPVEPDTIEVKRKMYRSKDGTEVSIFLVHPKGLEPDGQTPTLLYGYGGFNISLTPAFSPLAVTWAEQGGIYAVANLRGGGEYGEAWHEAGMLENKQNVFDDFIAAAEWLIESGYTSTEHLGIRGRSNGGLLVGAAMTQRPDLFGAVICGVPLLDMVRYHKFGIGQAWIPEYGSPEVEDQFRTLYAYSPYHHVEPDTAYPALLMLSADSDDRVDPMHARKFVAAVEHASTSDEVNLLRIEENSGHGGGDLRRQLVEQLADEVAFLSTELGR